jgi:hypothetical protein
MSPANIDRLRSIKTLPQLVAYLRDVLDWPIESDDTEAITFDYTAAELGLDEKAAVQIKEIKQLRPLASGQPWGIFFINFEKKRLPVVAMRRILRALAMRKRESANKSERQAWQSSDLLFISAYGEDSDRALTFAHFVESPDLNLAELRVLGWDDDDTPLKLDYVVRTLGEKLRWQDDFANHPKQWRAQWADAFRIRHGQVIRTSADLALALAVLARRIRARVSKILEMETGTGEIRTLQRAFRIGLIHDLDDAAFADMFAQTITYGLFSLACRRTVTGGGTAFVKDDLTHYFTSPFLKEMLGIFLGIKSRKGKIDFDELGISDVTDLLTSPDTHMEAVLIEFGNKTRGEDPVVHFYEDFLSAYNKQLKVQRGVFYTPQPVVSYIVRSVHELLQTEFGLADGLADTTTWGEMVKKHLELKLPPLTDEPGEKRTVKPDEPFVQILDPATGTATFIVEVIDVIHRHLKAKWKQQRLTEAQQRIAWNAYVPKHLLPRLHAFELMMAPYAIAHMKVGLKLAETGYQFAANERARIYLTNSLEPKVSQLPQLGFDALAREAEEVNDIKWYKRFTVVIGNPPYSNVGMMNRIPAILELLEDYKCGLDEKKLNLDDDFIKFIRFAQEILTSTRQGVLGFITSNTYFDGITHRRMRECLLESFCRISVLDLHGSTKKFETTPDGSKDENVFDIQQGVGLVLATARNRERAQHVQWAELWGARARKYAALERTYQSGGIAFKAVYPVPDLFFFVPKDFALQSEYEAHPRIPDIFLSSGPGVKTERDTVAIHWTLHGIEEAVADFRGKPDSFLRERYGLVKDSRDWKIENAKRDVLANTSKKLFRPILYRPFDHRYTWYSGQTRGFIGTPGARTMRQMLKPKALGLIVKRQARDRDYDWFLVTNGLVIDGVFSIDSKGRETTFPLYTADSSSLQEQWFEAQTNLSPSFLSKLSEKLGAAPSTILPEDIFYYAYAVFHSPGYRSRYVEFLKIDFPRLPLTGNLELFRVLAQLGGELTALHLLESPKLDHSVTEWVGGRNPEVEKISWTKSTVWVDKAQTQGFKGVREPFWNFHIGGYQVCEKWLKDRKGRTLTKDDIAHYHKIVVALSETIRLMAEIDKVIEKHGGWPGAFAGAAADTATPGVVPAKAPKADLGLSIEDELPLT